AHLAGQIEDDRSIPHEIVHRRLLPDVGDVHPNAVGDAVEVEEMPAGLRDERVDDEHVGAELDELAGEIAADEAEPARDENRLAPVKGTIVLVHGRGDAGYTGSVESWRRVRLADERRCWRNTTSAIHSRSTS